MIITVTEAHIKEGERESPFWCPVALALRDAGVIAPGVSEKKIVFGLDYPKELMTPDPVRRRISYYDNHGVMKPFSFELPL